MYRRALSIVLTALILCLGLPLPTAAGGYAVVHLDEEPAGVMAGMPWRLGFMVLQHDITPNSDVEPVVQATHMLSGETVTAFGEQEGAIGHFVAEITFPRSGEWAWSIEPRPFAETTFATLSVLAAPSPQTWPASMLLLQIATDRQSDISSEVAPNDVNTEKSVDILDPGTFAPDILQIEAGEIVRWVDQSATSHMVTGDTGAVENSGPIVPGQSFAARFTEPGTFRYQCNPHPGMTGVIVVT